MLVVKHSVNIRNHKVVDLSNLNLKTEKIMLT